MAERTEHEDLPLLHYCNEGNKAAVERVLNFAKVNVDSADASGRTALHIVASRGFHDIAQLLIERYAEVNVSTNGGTTPLAEACKCNHVDMVQFLLHHGARVNEVDLKGRGPLVWAILNGHQDVVMVLLQHPVTRVNMRTGAEKTPLHWAVKSAYPHIVKVLLEKASNLEINAGDHQNNTPLHKAVMKDYLNIVDLLVEHGADVELCNDRGDAALHLACREGRSRRVIEILLRQNVRLNARTRNGATALIEACARGQVKAVRMLLSRGARADDLDNLAYGPLDWAIFNGHLVVIAELLNHPKTDVNMSSRCGRSPLHWAVKTGNVDLVRFIVKLTSARINLNCADCRGDTPLHLAVRGSFSDIVSALISSRASVNLTNHANDAPIHEACRTHCTEILRILLASKVAVNLQNGDGSTALHMAVQHKNEESLKYILNHRSVDVDARDTRGCTALFKACEEGFENIVITLIRHGACTNFKDAEGTFPLHAACAAGRLSVIRHLLHPKNSDINATNRSGRTALWLACSRSHEQIAETLILYGADVNIADKKQRSPLFMACLHDLSPVVLQILQTPNCQIDSMSVHGCNPLHIACSHNRSDLVESLIRHGANVDFVNPKNHVTALHVAIWASNVWTCLLLIENMVNLNVVDFHGYTPLSRACQHKKTEVVRALLERRVDVNMADNEGKSPLHWAVEKQDREILLVLLSSSVHINAADIHGRTPLHITCEKGTLLHATYLVNARACTTVEDENGDTPLKLARRNHQEEIVQLLEPLS